MFKKKNVQVIAGVVLLLLIVLGGYFVISGNKKEVVESQVADEQIVQTLTPEELGLTLVPAPDKKRIKFKIEKASGIKSIEYELMYDADIPPAERLEGADGEDKVTRQVAGEAKVDSGKATYESKYLVLGSESANTIRYDTGVEEVTITLKITKADKKVYQVEDKLTL